jgi:hypothetical protein
MVGFNQSKGFLSQPSGGTGGSGFSAYAAGKKSYGLGQSSAPNTGKTANKVGYGQRDGEMAARRDALLNRAKGYL